MRLGPVPMPDFPSHPPPADWNPGHARPWCSVEWSFFKSCQARRLPTPGRLRLTVKAGVLSVFILVFSLVAGGGCASLQVANATTGLPRVIGWGSVTNISVKQGSIYRVRSPGVSLRFHSYAPGLTFGWHETLLFLPEAATAGQAPQVQPVAIRTRNYGIGVADYYLLIGAHSAFGIYEPTPGESFVQTIHFVPGVLTNAVITKEYK
jgi:hypothetical protein